MPMTGRTRLPLVNAGIDVATVAKLPEGSMGRVLWWPQAGPGRLSHLRAARSGGAALVSMVKTADLRDHHDVAITGWHDRTGNRRVLVQRQVSPGLFVVRAVPRHQLLHARFVQHNHVIETLATRRSHKSLDECILPRRVLGASAQ